MTPTQRAAALRLAEYWSADDWPGGLSGKKMDETAALLRELLAADLVQEPVAADEIERLRAEIAALLVRLDGFDIMGLAEAQHQLPGPFGGAGTPNAAMKETP